MGGGTSRTRHELAREMLSMLRIPRDEQDEGGKARTAMSLFDFLEIYPGDKRTHFGKLESDHRTMALLCESTTMQCQARQ